MTLCLTMTSMPRTTATATPARLVYLTFDDGPSQRYTPRVLDILRRERVRATFFVLGYRCDEFPRLVRRIRREGHEIGSHGYYHRLLVHEPEAIVKSDLLRADAAIEHACGTRPVYYRPPYGAMDEADKSLVQRLGHPIALWTVDSEDWKATSDVAIIANVRQAIRPRAIVLFHDGVSASRWTVRALPVLIRYLRSQGYSFQVLPV